MPQLLIRDVEPADHDQWVVLFAGYREFYQRPADEAVVETAWSWVLDRQHGMQGLVAVDAATGDVIGLANLRDFARPSAGAMGLFLDDLFTAPAARGRGAGAALLERAARLAADRGAVVVRWQTASDNSVARSLYDQHATLTPFIVYDMEPTSD
jgi:GNAT superfamily N-acetyltransferase